MSKKRGTVPETHTYPDIPQGLKDYIKEQKDKKGSLIMVLHKVQEYLGYVPKEICFILAKELNIPLARIYEVLTFYNYFKLQLPAKYRVSVCLGTACYLRGGDKVFEAALKHLGVKEQEVTPDGLFGVEKIRCLGCCAIGPVALVNEELYSKLDEGRIVEILNQYKEREKANGKPD